MDIAAWLSRSAGIAAGDLQSPAAASLMSFVERYAAATARFVDVRRGPEGEFVILDFQTGRPQKPVYPIRRTERIAVRFAPGDAMPFVYVLRADFPDTPHQQLAIEGAPRAICIDDRLWAEARLTWTPAELVHRILTWFERAAKGELHDARQPLDPLMIGSPLSFIISRRDLVDAAALDLVGVHDKNHSDTLRVMRLDAVRARPEDIEPLSLAAYRVAPEHMQRLTFAPDNLGSLADMLAARGIDLFGDLRRRFTDWLGGAEPPVWRINGRFAVIVEMPVIAPDGAQQDGTDLRAFITDKSVGELAVALGVAAPASKNEGSAVGFVKLLTLEKPDEQALRSINALSAEIHYEFDRTLATQLSGRKTPDARKVVLVGAGAIGSHLAECLCREGRFRWTVIDDDRVLPHNLGKHIARGGNVTAEKAALVAAAINATLDSEEPSATHITANVMTDGENRDRIDAALNEADLIIDATASVLAGRFLSDHPAAARRAGVFFNPAGTDGVLLVEPEDRSLTLRDLEAQYFALVSRDDRLQEHLTPADRGFAYTGACRAITNLMPETSAMVLAGLIGRALGRAVDADAPVMTVWSMAESGAVTVCAGAPSPVLRFGTGDWGIAIDHALIGRIAAIRDDKLPAETGGVLTGVVDIPAKTIHIAHAAPAPEDSTERPDTFVRGTAGVRDYLDNVFARTRGQVRYVGEWHSHPPRAAARPSATDLVQIDWLSTLFDLDTLPALMLIAGQRETALILANREAAPRPVPADDAAAGAGQ